MRPTAKSLILDLLSTLRSGTMPVRALVAAGEVFAIDGNGVRVALARLVADGLVASDGRGAYRLGERAGSVFAHVSSWRSVDARVRPWRGAWVGVHTGALPRSDRRRQRAASRALRLLGFRELERGLEIRPDNFEGAVDGMRSRLGELGLDDNLRVFGIVDLDDSTDALARVLWDVAAMRRDYRATLKQIERSSRRLVGLSEAAAMVESFTIGGAAIRQIVLDPLLPEEIVSGEDRRNLIAAMKEYDKLGRTCWATFMKAHGLPHRRAPQDLRALETAERIPLQAPAAAPGEAT